jgi:histidine triad (HIT) family protein
VDCLFCKIVAGEIPSMQVDEDELTLAFMDINPATPGHLLVIPKRHSANILDADPADLTAVTLTAQRMAHRVIETLGAAGVNIINSCGTVAWQTVFHLHFHVIPRYADDPARDSLRLPWEPAPGDLDTISAVATTLRRSL